MSGGQTIYEMPPINYAMPPTDDTLLCRVEGILVRTFDGGKTHDLCFQVNGRWSLPVPVIVRQERW